MSGRLPAIVTREDDESGGRRDSVESSPAEQRGGGDNRLGRQPPPIPPPPLEGQQRVPLAGQTFYERGIASESGGSGAHQSPFPRSIPPLRELEQTQEPSSIPPNINAPNLTRYENHVRKYLSLLPVNACCSYLVLP